MLQVISLGAGVQSTTMTLMAAAGEIEPMPDYAIFADTGAEPRRVYQHLKWMQGLELPFPILVVQFSNLRRDLRLTAKGVKDVAGRNNGYIAPPFHTRNADGSEGLLRRECTSNYKIRPIQKKIKELLGYPPDKPIRSKEPLATQWVGISKDEWERAKDSQVGWLATFHPFLDPDRWMSRHDCLAWLRKHDYPKAPRSACTFCPYRSAAEWRALREDEWDWNDAVRMDRIIRDMPDEERAGLRLGGKLYVHRDLVPLEEADIDKPDTGQTDLWAGECEGMCGV